MPEMEGQKRGNKAYKGEGRAAEAMGRRREREREKRAERWCGGKRHGMAQHGIALHGTWGGGKGEMG